eukprot:197706-Hanusia_phi.AAC.1
MHRQCASVGLELQLAAELGLALGWEVSVSHDLGLLRQPLRVVRLQARGVLLRGGLGKHPVEVRVQVVLGGGRDEQPLHVGLGQPLLGVVSGGVLDHRALVEGVLGDVRVLPALEEIDVVDAGFDEDPAPAVEAFVDGHDACEDAGLPRALLGLLLLDRLLDLLGRLGRVGPECRHGLQVPVVRLDVQLGGLGLYLDDVLLQIVPVAEADNRQELHWDVVERGPHGL